ncbi:MAG: hypothetical protein ACXWMT_08695, partial [Candidatus Binataceae bacterium]
EFIIPNYKQTWGAIRKIADAPEAVRHLTFKSEEYSAGQPNTRRAYPNRPPDPPAGRRPPVGHGFVPATSSRKRAFNLFVAVYQFERARHALP